MLLYQRDKHEALLTKWYFDLVAEPEEFERLFAAPLRNLTAILGWANSTVKIMMSLDREGIRAAAWVAPDLSGAWFGAWVRKNWRGSVGAVSFINQCYKMSLETFPVLLGVTKQKNLHELHLALGYKFVGEIPSWFDGDTAYIYAMTRESRHERRNRRHDSMHADAANPAVERKVRNNRRRGLPPSSGVHVARETEKEDGKTLRGELGLGSGLAEEIADLDASPDSGSEDHG